MSSIHFAFHTWNVKLHGLSPLTPYIKGHLTDCGICGAGNTSGMKKKCSSFDNESIVNLRVVTQSQVIPIAEGVTIQS